MLSREESEVSKLSTELETIIEAEKNASQSELTAELAIAEKERDNSLKKAEFKAETDKANVWRKPFIRDIDKIMHCPYFNRYADKTQVFSLYKNDDITRRNLHVQLVSRIARTIGATLHLNLDLIEAIALGHDMGHTPFGHTGEKILDSLYFTNANRHFAHNIQSVRVLDKIFNYNVSLQTLDGIAGHNGEIEKEKQELLAAQARADKIAKIKLMLEV